MDIKRVCGCAAIAAITLMGIVSEEPSQAAVMGAPVHSIAGANIKDYDDYGCQNNGDWRYQRGGYGYGDRGFRDNHGDRRDYGYVQYDRHDGDRGRDRDRDRDRRQDRGRDRDRDGYGH